jgi:hypothetical protein
VRNVTDIRLAVKRERMMLTKCKKGDRSFYHLTQVTVRFAPAFCAKDFQQFRVTLIALCSID